MPAAVTALIAAMIVVHLVRAFVLTPDQDYGLLLIFSFIPVRYTEVARDFGFPGGIYAEIWSPVTYGLIHGSATHLLINVVWLAAFGSALARRFGTSRFLVFTLLGTVAGAAAHWLVHPEDTVPVVGASAAISAHMAAVARFMFQSAGPLRANRRDIGVWHAEAVTLPGILADRRVLGFLGVWFGLNLAFGLWSSAFGGPDGTIAWEAHIGGFVFGLLAFSLFDPPPEDRARLALRHLGDDGFS